MLKRKTKKSTQSLFFKEKNIQYYNELVDTLNSSNYSIAEKITDFLDAMNPNGTYGQFFYQTKFNVKYKLTEKNIADLIKEKLIPMINDISEAQFLRDGLINLKASLTQQNEDSKETLSQLIIEVENKLDLNKIKNMAGYIQMITQYYWSQNPTDSICSELAKISDNANTLIEEKLEVFCHWTRKNQTLIALLNEQIKKGRNIHDLLNQIESPFQDQIANENAVSIVSIETLKNFSIEITKTILELITKKLIPTIKKIDDAILMQSQLIKINEVFLLEQRKAYDDIVNKVSNLQDEIIIQINDVDNIISLQSKLNEDKAALPPEQHKVYDDVIHKLLTRQNNLEKRDNKRKSKLFYKITELFTNYFRKNAESDSSENNLIQLGKEEIMLYWSYIYDSLNKSFKHEQLTIKLFDELNRIIMSPIRKLETTEVMGFYEKIQIASKNIIQHFNSYKTNTFSHAVQEGLNIIEQLSNDIEQPINIEGIIAFIRNVFVRTVGAPSIDINELPIQEPNNIPLKENIDVIIIEEKKETIELNNNESNVDNRIDDFIFDFIDGDINQYNNSMTDAEVELVDNVNYNNTSKNIVYPSSEYLDNYGEYQNYSDEENDDEDQRRKSSPSFFDNAITHSLRDYFKRTPSFSVGKHDGRSELIIIVDNDKKEKIYQALLKMMKEDVAIDDNLIDAFFDAINPDGVRGKILFIPVVHYWGIEEKQPGLNTGHLKKVIDLFIVLIGKIDEIKYIERIYTKLVNDEEDYVKSYHWTNNNQNVKCLGELIEVAKNRWTEIATNIDMKRWEEQQEIQEKDLNSIELEDYKEDIKKQYGRRWLVLYGTKKTEIEQRCIDISNKKYKQPKETIHPNALPEFVKLSISNCSTVQNKIDQCCQLLQDSVDKKENSYPLDIVFDAINHVMIAALNKEDDIVVFYRKLKDMEKIFKADEKNAILLNDLIFCLKMKRECLLLLNGNDNSSVILAAATTGVENCWKYFYHRFNASLDLLKDAQKNDLSALLTELDAKINTMSIMDLPLCAAKVKTFLESALSDEERECLSKSFQPAFSIINKLQKSSSINSIVDLRNLFYQHLFGIEMPEETSHLNIPNYAKHRFITSVALNHGTSSKSSAPKEEHRDYKNGHCY